MKMEEEILNIIRQICSEKELNKIHPDFATAKEIIKIGIINCIPVSDTKECLNNLVTKDLIEFGDVINGFWFRLK